MMTKLLWLLLLLLPVMAFAEDACPLCGGVSDLCLTDEVGAVYCSGTLVSYPDEHTAESYTVREGTSIIGEWAFAGNDSLVEVILPDGVAMIDTGAFEGCNGLRRVELPDSLLIIGKMAFYYCTELTDVVLPPHLYAIGPSAFVDCWKLTTISIPETVGYIGSEAFCNTGLTEVWLRTISFELGYTIFTPNEQFSKARPLTIHVSEEMLYDEVGNLWHFIDEYESGYNVTFVYDVPYLD